MERTRWKRDRVYVRQCFIGSCAHHRGAPLNTTLGVMNRALASLILCCGHAMAQAPSLPPEIDRVTTLGWWQSGSTAGTYRVVTTTQGWEHLWSRVFVEWLPEPASREEARKPISVVELIPPIAQGTAVLDANARSVKPGEIMISMIATPNSTANARTQRFSFRARQPGVVERIETRRKQ